MRITLLAGHYGSGKTQLAVNLALGIRRKHERVAVADLDIVNPYFRTLDCKAVLEAAGIRLLSSPYAGSNVELPSLPPDAAAIFDDAGLHSVIDVGGDDRGALALGRYADRLRGSAEMLLVINKYRPLTSDPRSAAEFCREIEAAGKIAFTGIANNSNLGAETTAGDVLAALPYAAAVSEELGLPVKFNSAREDLCAALEGRVENLLPIKIYTKTAWKIEN